MNKSKIVLLLAIVTIVFFISNVHGEEDRTSLSDSLESRIIRDAQRKGIKKRKGNISKRKQKGGKRKQQRKKSIKRKGKGKKINRKLNKRKGNGEGKRKRQSKKRKPSKAETRRKLDEACFKKAVGDLNKLSSFVANFIKQMKRVEKQTKVAGNKNEKSGIFPDVAALLVNLGGGNVSSLSCAGSTTSEGAKNLTNLVNNLLACEENITKACSTDFPQYNQTFVEECNTTINTFSNGVEECVALTNKNDTSKACACWEDLDSKSVGDCKKIPEAESIREAFEVCKISFGKCKKYEDDSISIFSECSGRIRY